MYVKRNNSSVKRIIYTNQIITMVPTYKLHPIAGVNLYIEKGVQEFLTDHRSPLSGHYKEMFFRDIHIIEQEIGCRKGTIVQEDMQCNCVQLYFVLEGKIANVFDTCKKAFSFDAHQHNIIYPGNHRRTIEFPEEVSRLFIVSISEEFFRKFCPEDASPFRTFKTDMENGCASALNGRNGHISLEMHQIIDEIMHCTKTGMLKQMFFKAKVIELLSLQFEQLGYSTAEGHPLKGEDMDKIYLVRDYILQNLHRTSSLVDLAHMAGTNEFALKKGFKKLFKTTVFGFWNDAKMAHAKLLLTEEEISVSQVSDRVGYKNYRHFSAAFKKKYGITPSQLRKGA